MLRQLSLSDNNIKSIYKIKKESQELISKSIQGILPLYFSPKFLNFSFFKNTIIWKYHTRNLRGSYKQVINVFHGTIWLCPSTIQFYVATFAMYTHASPDVRYQ